MLQYNPFMRKNTGPDIIEISKYFIYMVRVFYIHYIFVVIKLGKSMR